MLRPLVVGGGTMGALHVRALLARDDVQGAAVVDPDPIRRDALVRQSRLVSPYARLDEALAREALDVAIVAVPLGVVAEVVAPLLGAGIPVLAEKPLAMNVAAAQELAELAANSGTLLSVGYIERFNPAVQALKDELEQGGAGPVYHVHTRRLGAFPYRAGMAGVTLDVATHDLDVLGFITESVPVRVYAETAVRQGNGAEDLLCASLRFGNGVTGLIEANWLTPMKVRRLTVTAQRGMYVVDYLTQDLWLHEHSSSDAGWDTLGVVRGANEGRTIRFGLDRREPLVVEHDRFVEAALTGGTAPVPPAEAIAVLRTAEAIVESGQTNLPVSPSGVALG